MTNLKLSKITVLTLLTLLIYCGNGFSAEFDGHSSDIQLTEQEVHDRIKWIESRFRQGDMHAKTWQYGWTTAFSASILRRSYTLGTGDNSDERFDAGVGILTSSSGLLSVLLKPLPSAHASSTLFAMPEATPEQRLQKLRKAEQLLEESAMEIERRRGWKIQGVFLLEQLLAGLAIGIADDRPEDGLKFAGMGLLASELFTFTTPTQSVNDWNTYRLGHSTPRKTSNLFFIPHPRGIDLVYLF
jgi:hypothetical protein